MRKLIAVAALLVLWALPAYSQVLPIPIRLPTLCCQNGVTYGGGADNSVSCHNVSIIGPGERECIQGGGTITTGPCNSNGACGGSTVCCQGCTIFGECTSFGTGPGTAPPSGCTAATERACDALSAAGTRATESVPGATCNTDSGSCVTPTP
jgi:hypothetical protein